MGIRARSTVKARQSSEVLECVLSSGCCWDLQQQEHELLGYHTWCNVGMLL